MYSATQPSHAEVYSLPAGLQPSPVEHGPRGDIEPLGESLLVKARQTIFMEGDRANYLYKVARGVVRTYKILACGRRQLTGFLFEGDYFGSHQFDCYHTTAEAVSSATVIRYRLQARASAASSAAASAAASATWAAAALELVRKAALSELRSAEDQVMLLGRMSSGAKVAAFLLYLSERAEARGETANPIEVPMTRYDIADFLGLTAESVSRSLTRLKQAGLIEMVSSDAVELLDPDALCDVPRGF